ncbi:lysosome-associated membrane glycoprotein 1-like [Andrena cerasifolii]|uniref:lysosome-associated membrane glycoprotein 1-like n=1 Tax=Andrena cerasifolii TaxID=2819439 RepID=UPI004037BB12
MFRFGSTGNISFLQDIAYDLYLDNKTFPDARFEGSRYENTLKSVNIFAASKNHEIYKCALETTVRNINVAITITDVALIAFNTEQSVATKTEENCVPATDPATTPLPPPDPSVTEFNYYVRDPETGVACILANMSISIEANYISMDYNLKTATLKIPPTAEVRGTCRNTTPTMELIWAEDPILEGALNGIALMFGSTDNTFFLQDIILELYIDNKTFPDALQEGKRFGTKLQQINKFSASKSGGLYRCEPETRVGTGDFKITITDVTLIAFNTEESVATRTEENCNSGAEVAQWSGYLLLAANILIFLKLSNQGI